MLARHPLILEAGVVGVPDKQWGQRPKAYITVKNNISHDSSSGDGSSKITVNEEEGLTKNQVAKVKLSGEDVIRWAKRGISEGGGGISGFMIPREVEVVSELPKTATGKVKKGVLREWAKD